jgi:hypothetical protein
LQAEALARTFQSVAASAWERTPRAAPQLTMAEGVDAAMKAAKALGTKPFVDSANAHAGGEDLRATDDAILTCRDDRQTPIHRPRKSPLSRPTRLAVRDGPAL